MFWYLVIVLFEVIWDSWICGLIYFCIFGKFSAILSQPISIFSLFGGACLSLEFRLVSCLAQEKLWYYSLFSFFLLLVEAMLFSRKKWNSLYYLNWKLQISICLLYKTVKVLRFLPYLQINYVSCLHFMDAGQRMRLLSQIKVSLLLISIGVFSKHQFP